MPLARRFRRLGGAHLQKLVSRHRIASARRIRLRCRLLLLNQGAVRRQLSGHNLLILLDHAVARIYDRPIVGVIFAEKMRFIWFANVGAGRRSHWPGIKAVIPAVPTILTNII